MLLLTHLPSWSNFAGGELSEWPKEPDSKSGVGASSPWVRIPRSPPVLRFRDGVETKALVRAVKRNVGRFPEDFMFQLTKAEFDNLRYQSGTSRSWGGRRTSWNVTPNCS